MRPKQTFLPEDSAFPFQGLSGDAPSTLLDSKFSPRLSNVLVTNGIVSNRTGYLQLGGDVQGTVIGLIDFEDNDGNEWLVCVTTERMYRFDFSGPSWVEITNGVVLDDFESISDWHQELNVALTDEGTIKKVGSNSMKVAVAADFTTGLMCSTDDFSPVVNVTAYAGIDVWVYSSIALNVNEISIVLAEDSAGVKTNNYETFLLPAIAATTWTHVRVTGTFSDLNVVKSLGIYGEVDVGACSLYFDDLRVSESGLWTGDEDDILDWEVATDDDHKWLFITNGKDTPQRWHGSSNFEDMVCDYAAFDTCRSIRVFFNHLFLGGVKTAAWAGQFVIWSVAGDFEDWTGTGSGAQLLADSDGDIR